MSPGTAAEYEKINFVQSGLVPEGHGEKTKDTINSQTDKEKDRFMKIIEDHFEDFTLSHFFFPIKQKVSPKVINVNEEIPEMYARGQALVPGHTFIYTNWQVLIHLFPCVYNRFF